MHLLLIVLETGFSGFDFGLRRLGFLHQVEDVVFNLSDRLLCVLDFMLQRPVLFVRFHRQHLLAVFRDFRFDGGDVRFELLPIGLIVLGLFFRGFKSGLRRTKFLIESF